MSANQVQQQRDHRIPKLRAVQPAFYGFARTERAKKKNERKERSFFLYHTVIYYYYFFFLAQTSSHLAGPQGSKTRPPIRLVYIFGDPAPERGLNWFPSA